MQARCVAQGHLGLTLCVVVVPHTLTPTTIPTLKPVVGFAPLTPPVTILLLFFLHAPRQSLLQFGPFFPSPRRSCSTGTAKTRYAEAIRADKDRNTECDFLPQVPKFSPELLFRKVFPHSDALFTVHRDYQTSVVASKQEKKLKYCCEKSLDSAHVYCAQKNNFFLRSQTTAGSLAC